MSKVETRSNLIELQSVPLSGFVGSAKATSAVCSALAGALTSVVGAAVNELVTGSVELETITFESSLNKTLYSPLTIKHQFTETYTANMEQMSSVSEKLIKQKAAVIKTINASDYKITSPKVVEEGFRHVIAAKTQKELVKSVESVMNIVHEQHNNVFTQEVAGIVKNASIKSNFQNVQIKTLNNVVTVIALNQKGEALLSEIRTDAKTKQIDLVTETIGISDGTCNNVLKDFDSALRESGIKFNSTTSKWTGGACWLPNSQKVDSELKVRKANKDKDLQERKKQSLINQKINNNLKGR
jgi:hypothetical protein